MPVDTGSPPSHASEAERGNMAAPDWVRRILAVAMIGVAMYHLSRLAIFRRSGLDPKPTVVQVDVELTHVAMGSAMALMVSDTLAPDDLRGLVLVFVVPMFWFLLRTVRGYVRGGPKLADIAARQVIACAAMAYMLLAVAGTPMRPGFGAGMNGMSMGTSVSPALSAFSSPILRLVVIVAIAGLCAWTVARHRAHAPSAGPAMGVGCQLAVNATTIFMLIAL